MLCLAGWFLFWHFENSFLWNGMFGMRNAVIFICILFTFVSVVANYAQSLPWYEDFSDNDLTGWTAVDDQPNTSGPGQWLLDQSVLRQASNIYVTENEYSVFLGTHIFAGNKSWQDYSFNALVKSEDDDGIGILFRYQDANNYYRLILLQDAGNLGPFQRLQKRVKGSFTTLAEATPSQAIPTGWFALTADVRGDSIKIYLNSTLIFSTVDADKDLPQGSVGFTCYAHNGAYFDSVLVSEERIVYQKPIETISYVDRAPYIQIPKQESVQIAWRSKDKVLGKVEFGESLAYGRIVSEDTSSHKHLLFLSNLQPNTRYYYRVLNDAQVIAEGDTFRTAKPDSIDKVSLVIWGDSGTGGEAQFRMASLLEEQAVDFCLHVGDVSQSNGSEYDNIFFKPYQNIVRSRCIFTSIGNHDTYFNNAATYLDDFYLPHNNPDSTERYYSFNWGNVHCIALNSMEDISPASKQYAWLVSDLSSDFRKRTTWTFVYFHYPPYCQGWDTWAGDVATQQYWVPLFEQYKVDMVFNGHTHDYERGYLNGVYYIITGGGGGGMDVWGRDYPHIDVTIFKHHFTRLDVDGDKLLLRAIDIDNVLIDSLTIRKGEKPPQHPGKKEAEPNDSYNQANPIAVGDTLQANFSSTADIDWYQFHLEALHMYYFTSIESQPDVQPDLELYFDGDLQNLLSVSVSGRNGCGDFRLSGYLAGKTGTYYARISNRTSATGPYKIRLVGGRSVQELFVREPDNSTVQAATKPALAAGDTVYGAVFPIDDRDHYKVVGKEGWQYEIGTIPALDQGVRDTDTYIFLLDSLGQVLKEADDRGNEETSTGELINNTFSVIKGAFPYSGSYYLKVESYYTSARGEINESRPGAGEYGLVFQTSEPPYRNPFVKGPYLQNVYQNRITIMWETEYPQGSMIEYGSASAYGNQVVDITPVRIHELTLRNLEPETLYHYRVGYDTTFSLDHTFRTAPNRETPFCFAVYGDNRTDVAMHSLVVQSIVVSQPDFVVNVGDIVSNGTVLEQWTSEFFAPALELISKVPVYVAIGNHEQNSQYFYDFFSFPKPENYYSFNYGNSHFIIIDSNPWTDYSPDSDQYKWLVEDLESDDCRKADWVFVFFHQPPWSQQWDSPGYTGEASVREYLVPLLESSKVDMVFNGHTHDYERGNHNGVYYIITGGGGSALDRVLTGSWPHIAVWKSEYHHCALQVNGKTLEFRAIRPDGVVIDSLSISKAISDGPETSKPDVPTEFALHQSYPNPFNQGTVISFDLPAATMVKIQVVDLLGRIVQTILEQKRPAGFHKVIWDGHGQEGRELPSGVYFARVSSTEGMKAIKMILMH